MEDMLEKIELLQNMRLKDGDILVVTVDESCSEKDKELLSNIIENFLKENNINNKILIKSNDVNFEILRKEDILNGEH